MKPLRLIPPLATAFLLACLAIPALAITLPTIEDTTATTLSGVQKIVKIDNNAVALYVKGTGATPKHALVMFDLRDVPTTNPADILSAKLRLYFSVVTSPGALTVHQITGTWDESSPLATQPEPAFVSTAAGMIAATLVTPHDYATVDVTSVVKAWLGGASNEGLLIKGDSTANVTLASKERKGGGYPAELEVVLVSAAASGGAGSVTTVQLADTAVTTAKLADSAVTPAKLNLTTGNVGIGTASPAFRLDVTGTARAGSLLTTQQAGLELKPYGTTAGQTSEIRLDALTGANFVGFKAPDTIAASRVYTLPAADGAAGTFLSTNGTGLLSWAAAAGGGGGAVTSVAGRTGAVTLSAPDIGGLGALATQNSVTTITGNAGTATALATGHTISISGDLAYASPSFNGSGDVTAIGTLATVNSNVGPFGSSTQIPVVTVNAKGLVTAVSTVAAAAPTGVALLAGGNSFTGNQTVSTGTFRVGAGATGTAAVEVNGVISLFDSSTKTLNAGISTEVAGQLINFGINDSSNNRFGGTYTQASQGGYFRLDARSGVPLFQVAGRAAGAATTTDFLTIDSAGAVSISGSAPVELSIATAAGKTLQNWKTASGSAGFNLNYTGIPGQPGLYFSENGVNPSNLVLREGGKVGINTSNPANTLDVNGGIKCTGAVDTSSDARYKKNVQPLANTLDMTLRLRGVSYDWKRDAFPDKVFSDRHQLGFIAQEVREVLPDVVSQDLDGYLSIGYTAIIPVLAEAVKELKAQKDAEIAVLQEKIAALEARDAARDARLTRLESALEAQPARPVRTSLRLH